MLCLSKYSGGILRLVSCVGFRKLNYVLSTKPDKNVMQIASYIDPSLIHFSHDGKEILILNVSDHFYLSLDLHSLSNVLTSAVCSSSSFCHAFRYGVKICLSVKSLVFHYVITVQIFT